MTPQELILTLLQLLVIFALGLSLLIIGLFIASVVVSGLRYLYELARGRR